MSSQTQKEGLSLSKVWGECLRQVDVPIRSILNDAQPVSCDESTFVVGIPQFSKDFLTKQGRNADIEKILQNLTGNPKLTVEYVVVESSEKVTQNRPYQPKQAPAEPEENLDKKYMDHSADHYNRTNLQVNLTFDSFVASDNNNLAVATAIAVAEKPGTSYNPLFLWGGVGLGKTHLINAIGNYILKEDPNKKVIYVPAEQFTNEFIESVRYSSTDSSLMTKFRNKYRNVDVLLIDDVHFIINKEGVQEEFFQTFDSLHRASKQIVISSDRPPKQMPTIIDRLRTRFEWGMIADIQAPNLETRVAILKKKAEELPIYISLEVLTYIAEEFYSNIRELEGALNRVVAFCSLTKIDINIDNAKKALSGIIGNKSTQIVDIGTIQKVVCEYFNISESDLLGTRRDQRIVKPRQIAMYLCKELTEASYPDIGEKFGGKDHTTVMHAYRKVEDNINESYFKNSLNNIKERLK